MECCASALLGAAAAGNELVFALRLRVCCRSFSVPPQVLGGSEEYAEQLGALLWPQLAAAYIAAKLKPIAPQSDAEVGLMPQWPVFECLVVVCIGAVRSLDGLVQE